MKKLYFLFSLLFMFPAFSYTLKVDAPSRYEIQEGDTLWGIANRFLVYPWEWKSLWHANPKIKNPNRLYPGAIIELRYRAHQPYLRVLSNGMVKLTPNLRPVATSEAIPTISLNDMKPFLDGSVVLDKNTLAEAPFVIAFTIEHMLGGQGDEVYVKNLCPKNVFVTGQTYSYALYRPCGRYFEPLTHRFLGYKAKLIGYANLSRVGDPATVVLTNITEGVKLEDRVMPNNYPNFDLYFEPKTPAIPIRGSIIDVLGDYTQGAVGLVVVMDRGQDAGVQPGDVLGVYSRPRLVQNAQYRYKKQGPCEDCVRTPPERIGEVMIFRTFTHTSIGLVMRSIRAISLLDTVTNP